MAPTSETGGSDEGDIQRVLGIEGTAWAASAAVYEGKTGDVFIESDPYQPESGGIHPREAAEHMSEAVPEVVETAIETAREWAADAGDDPENPIDAVAFSRGPGLGPCLRIVGTAARSVAQRFDVPLVGVNHMVAHLEIGRHQSGFEAPVCLNASGANAHVLAYRNGRYRVLGETMDTGVGNAIDKFTRHVGWSHPGGPKVETHAKEGEYVDLPYVVKGMDFSFSGIMSAAKQEYDGVRVSGANAGSSDERSESDGGTPVEDVCRGLEETIFAMLTEVSERALSLTGRDELVLGGGVAQNERLQGMLQEMCDQRGASLHVPENRFLRDNAGMIAVLGAKMVAAGDTLAIEDSAIDSDFRPDDVSVTWRSSDPDPVREPASANAGGAIADDDAIEYQGAEATVTIDGDEVVKRRNPRSYRHPALDERLRRERTRIEARLTSEARRQGVPTPLVRDVDTESTAITLQRVGDSDLDGTLTPEHVRAVGRHLATIHDAGFVHGDPTTRNVRVETGESTADADPDRVFLIDFGLGYHTGHEEDHAMDLHVFAQSLAGTADDAERLQAAAEAAYRETSERADTVLDRLRAIEGRGRYQ